MCSSHGKTPLLGLPYHILFTGSERHGLTAWLSLRVHDGGTCQGSH